MYKMQYIKYDVWCMMKICLDLGSFQGILGSVKGICAPGLRGPLEEITKAPLKSLRWYKADLELLLSYKPFEPEPRQPSKAD